MMRGVKGNFNPNQHIGSQIVILHSSLDVYRVLSRYTSGILPDWGSTTDNGKQVEDEKGTPAPVLRRR